IAKQLSTPLTKSFPSNTQDNPKGQCKSITLRSGKTLEDSTNKVDAEATSENAMEKSSKKPEIQQQQPSKAAARPESSAPRKETNIPFPQ
ncbi:hypothetical protein PIB30_115090, partial [Stylosanthes scabra]|nr:hypothetical protein [Stylosanthes scabra]